MSTPFVFEVELEGKVGAVEVSEDSTPDFFGFWSTLVDGASALGVSSVDCTLVVVELLASSMIAVVVDLTSGIRVVVVGLDVVGSGALVVVGVASASIEVDLFSSFLLLVVSSLSSKTTIDLVLSSYSTFFGSPCVSEVLA